MPSLLYSSLSLFLPFSLSLSPSFLIHISWRALEVWNCLKLIHYWIFSCRLKSLASLPHNSAPIDCLGPNISQGCTERFLCETFSICIHLHQGGHKPLHRLSSSGGLLRLCLDNQSCKWWVACACSSAFRCCTFLLGLHLTTADKRVRAWFHHNTVTKLSSGVTYHPFCLQTLPLSCSWSLPHLAISACLFLPCRCASFLFLVTL